MYMANRRPTGVTIIAILVAIGGVLEVIGGLLLLIVPFLGLFTLALGIVSLILAWGLWTLKPWAFWVAVILEAINAIEGLINLLRGNGSSLFSLIVSVAILLYLFLDPNVRAAFRT